MDRHNHYDDAFQLPSAPSAVMIFRAISSFSVMTAFVEASEHGRSSHCLINKPLKLMFFYGLFGINITVTKDLALRHRRY